MTIGIWVHDAPRTTAVFPFHPSRLYDLGQDWVDRRRSDPLDAVHVGPFRGVR